MCCSKLHSAATRPAPCRRRACVSGSFPHAMIASASPSTVGGSPGALVAALAQRDRSREMRRHEHPASGAIGLRLFAPWVVFAWQTFGTPIPNSLLAKAAGHQGYDRSLSLQNFADYFRSWSACTADCACRRRSRLGVCSRYAHPAGLVGLVGCLFDGTHPEQCLHP